MRKKILGWVMFFGGIFCGIAGVGSSLQRPANPGYLDTGVNFFIVAFWATVAIALIWGGWKLSHGKK